MQICQNRRTKDWETRIFSSGNNQTRRDMSLVFVLILDYNQTFIKRLCSPSIWGSLSSNSQNSLHMFTVYLTFIKLSGRSPLLSWHGHRLDFLKKKKKKRSQSVNGYPSFKISPYLCWGRTYYLVTLQRTWECFWTLAYRTTTSLPQNCFVMHV